MRSIDIASFCEGGIIREESFRKRVDQFDWEQYRGKRVLIQGCAAIPIPTWAYMMVTARLAKVAGSINYGEVTAPLPIYTAAKPNTSKESSN
jgi:hypothetical protein